MIGPLDLVKFGRVYAECIKARQESDPERYSFINLGFTPEVVVVKMLRAVAGDTKNKGGSDWLKHNPALKDAAKRFGIKTSQELRVLVIDAYERDGLPHESELEVQH